MASSTLCPHLLQEYFKRIREISETYKSQIVKFVNYDNISDSLLTRKILRVEEDSIIGSLETNEQKMSSVLDIFESRMWGMENLISVLIEVNVDSWLVEEMFQKYVHHIVNEIRRLQSLKSCRCFEHERRSFIRRAFVRFFEMCDDWLFEVGTSLGCLDQTIYPTRNRLQAINNLLPISRNNEDIIVLPCIDLVSFDASYDSEDGVEITEVPTDSEKSPMLRQIEAHKMFNSSTGPASASAIAVRNSRRSEDQSKVPSPHSPKRILEKELLRQKPAIKSPVPHSKPSRTSPIPLTSRDVVKPLKTSRSSTLESEGHAFVARNKITSPPSLEQSKTPTLSLYNGNQSTNLVHAPVMHLRNHSNEFLSPSKSSGSQARNYFTSQPVDMSHLQESQEIKSDLMIFDSTRKPMHHFQERTTEFFNGNPEEIFQNLSSKPSKSYPAFPSQSLSLVPPSLPVESEIPFSNRWEGASRSSEASGTSPALTTNGTLSSWNSEKEMDIRYSKINPNKSPVASKTAVATSMPMKSAAKSKSVSVLKEAKKPKAISTHSRKLKERSADDAISNEFHKETGAFSTKEYSNLNIIQRSGGEISNSTKTSNVNQDSVSVSFTSNNENHSSLLQQQKAGCEMEVCEMKMSEKLPRYNSDSLKILKPETDVLVIPNLQVESIGNVAKEGTHVVNHLPLLPQRNVENVIFPDSTWKQNSVSDVSRSQCFHPDNILIPQLSNSLHKEQTVVSRESHENTDVGTLSNFTSTSTILTINSESNVDTNSEGYSTDDSAVKLPENVFTEYGSGSGNTNPVFNPVSPYSTSDSDLTEISESHLAKPTTGKKSNFETENNSVIEESSILSMKGFDNEYLSIANEIVEGINEQLCSTNSHERHNCTEERKKKNVISAVTNNEISVEKIRTNPNCAAQLAQSIENSIFNTPGQDIALPVESSAVSAQTPSNLTLMQNSEVFTSQKFSDSNFSAEDREEPFTTPAPVDSLSCEHIVLGTEIASIDSVGVNFHNGLLQSIDILPEKSQLPTYEEKTQYPLSSISPQMTPGETFCSDAVLEQNFGNHNSSCQSNDLHEPTDVETTIHETKLASTLAQENKLQEKIFNVKEILQVENEVKVCPESLNEENLSAQGSEAPTMTKDCKDNESTSDTSHINLEKALRSETTLNQLSQNETTLPHEESASPVSLPTRSPGKVSNALNTATKIGRKSKPDDASEFSQTRSSAQNLKKSVRKESDSKSTTSGSVKKTKPEKQLNISNSKGVPASKNLPGAILAEATSDGFVRNKALISASKKNTISNLISRLTKPTASSEKKTMAGSSTHPGGANQGRFSRMYLLKDKAASRPITSVNKSNSSRQKLPPQIPMTATPKAETSVLTPPTKDSKSPQPQEDVKSNTYKDESSTQSEPNFSDKDSSECSLNSSVFDISISDSLLDFQFDTDMMDIRSDRLDKFFNFQIPQSPYTPILTPALKNLTASMISGRRNSALPAPIELVTDHWIFTNNSNPRRCRSDPVLSLTNQMNLSGCGQQKKNSLIASKNTDLQIGSALNFNNSISSNHTESSQNSNTSLQNPDSTSAVLVDASSQTEIILKAPPIGRSSVSKQSSSPTLLRKAPLERKDVSVLSVTSVRKPLGPGSTVTKPKIPTSASDSFVSKFSTSPSPSRQRQQVATVAPTRPVWNNKKHPPQQPTIHERFTQFSVEDYNFQQWANEWTSRQEKKNNATEN